MILLIIILLTQNSFLKLLENFNLLKNYNCTESQYCPLSSPNLSSSCVLLLTNVSASSSHFPLTTPFPNISLAWGLHSFHYQISSLSLAYLIFLLASSFQALILLIPVSLLPCSFPYLQRETLCVYVCVCVKQYHLSALPASSKWAFFSTSLFIS